MTPRRRALYQTQVTDVTASWGSTRHLVVWRHDGKGGIPWEDLQELKDEALGKDVCAVEFYPRKWEVVNEVNRRHLWEIPDVLPGGVELTPPLNRKDQDT